MKYLYSILCILSFTFSATAQTTIAGGDISGTLTAANGPYTITGDITVPADSLLVIEPGVSLYFNDTTKLIVRGNVKAIGTESNIITLTKSGTDSLEGWGGVFILNDSKSDTNYFKHCEITYTAVGGNYFLWLIPSEIIFSAGINAQSASPCVISSCSFSKQKFAVRSNKTDMIIKNCDFKKSSRFLVEPEDYLTRDIDLQDGYIVVDGCVFEDDLYSIRVGDVHNDDEYNIRNCDFKNIRGQAALLYGRCNISKCTFLNTGSQAINLYFFNGIVDQCLFDSSYGISNKGKNISINGSASNFIQNCTFSNTQPTSKGLAGFDIYAPDGAMPFMYNCTFDNALGVYSDGNTFSSTISNCIVRNSKIGFTLEGNYKILNSLFVNNRVSNIDSTSLASTNASPAVTLVSANVDIYNSIFWNNNDYYGANKNIHFYDAGTVNLYNCILKGGTSSITKYQDPSFVFNGIYQDCSSDFPRFVDSSNGDFRPYQDCNQTPSVLNKGYTLPITGRLRELGGQTTTYTDILAQLTDADGNPRVWNDTIDIGPYEVPLRKTVEAYEQPSGLALCENESGVLSSLARGIGVSSTWQSSSDGGTYSDLGVNTDNLSLDEIQEADSGTLYRVMWRNQCFDTLYSIPAMLSVHTPTPISLGEDFILHIDSSARLSPGQGFRQYTWNNGFTAPIVNIQGKNLGLGEHGFSVEVKNQYGCISSDSITVTVQMVNSINGSSSKMELTLYPNPGSSLIKVKGLDDFSYTIYNLSGQELVSKDTAIGEIDTEDLTSGTYLISIQKGDELFRIRWVKM